MFKDLMNVAAGEMLYKMGYSTMLFEQQMQLMIVVLGSNPFWG